MFGRLRWATDFLPVLALLALAWPFINFVDVNRTMLGAPQYLRLGTYFVGLAAILLVLWALLRAFSVVRANSKRVDAAIAVLIAMLFAFVPVMNVVATIFGLIGLQRGGMIAYVILWAGSGIAMLWLSGKGGVRAILATFLLVAIAFPAANFLLFLVQPRASTVVETAATTTGGASFVTRPNVYFLVMDAYARSDRLKQYFGSDDEGFLAQLEERGFRVQRQFYANYPSTFLSLSSTLSMEYMALPETRFSDRSEFISAIVGSGAVYEKFREQGYLIAHASSMVTSAGCQGNEDFCLDSGVVATLGELEFGLLNLTPFGVALERLALRYLPPQTLSGFENAVGALPADRPIFHFIHSNPPHVPFFLTDACAAGPVTVREVAEVGPEMSAAYLNSVRCAAEGALHFIDAVLKRDPSAVIVLQSDHGSGQTVDWMRRAAEWTQEQIEERLAAFSAIRAPQQCGPDLEKLASAVNTFRVIFACLEARPANLLADRFFIGSYETVDDFGVVHEVFPLAGVQ